MTGDRPLFRPLRESSLNGNMLKLNDCNHNESDTNNISPENIEKFSYVTGYGLVIKKPVRFRDP